jgi:hypothetical protein
MIPPKYRGPHKVPSRENFHWGAGNRHARASREKVNREDCPDARSKASTLQKEIHRPEVKKVLTITCADGIHSIQTMRS